WEANHDLSQSGEGNDHALGALRLWQRQAWCVGWFSKRSRNRGARSQEKRVGYEASRRRGSESSEGGERGCRAGRKEQGTESRCYAACGCEGREADERLHQVRC